MSDGDGDRAMACLSAIRQGRAWFDAKMAEHMAAHLSPADTDSTELTATVRSDNAYHVAEFFYLAQALGLLRRDRLPRLIAQHNKDMDALLTDTARAWHMGLSPQRLRKAKFTDNQRRKIIEGQEHDGQEMLQLDQSDVGRLLAPLMAPEVCRQVLAAMTKGGLLKAWGFGRILISSPGIVEGYYREHLVMIDRAVRGME
jgi:hypothetical protein